MGAIDPSPPLSVVIPTLNAEARLDVTLTALDGGRALIREIIVADGGSSDGTVRLARERGLRLVEAPPGRGAQLAAGACVAEGQWLCFLHADTRLAAGWAEAVRRFIADAANQRLAAYFRYRLDDDARAARRIERVVLWRCRVFGLPYGDQGLLI